MNHADIGNRQKYEGERMMRIWKVTVVPKGSKGIAKGYLFEAKDIIGAIEQGSKYGEVVKAVLDEWDE